MVFFSTFKRYVFFLSIAVKQNIQTSVIGCNYAFWMLMCVWETGLTYIAHLFYMHLPGH